MKIEIINLQSIASAYGIKKFVKVEAGDKYCKADGQDTYENRSFIAGNDEIYLGIYSDEQLMIASFFHELGHIVDSKNGKFNSEALAWLIGFKLAREHGFEFERYV